MKAYLLKGHYLDKITLHIRIVTTLLLMTSSSSKQYKIQAQYFFTTG